MLCVISDIIILEINSVYLYVIIRICSIISKCIKKEVIHLLKTLWRRIRFLKLVDFNSILLMWEIWSKTHYFLLDYIQERYDLPYGKSSSSIYIFNTIKQRLPKLSTAHFGNKLESSIQKRSGLKLTPADYTCHFEYLFKCYFIIFRQNILLWN